MPWLHPFRRRLIAWADNVDDPRIQAHVEQCERCLGIVEEAGRFDDIPLGNVLGALLRAPDSLEEELVERAEIARSNRASLEILGGLAVLPWETLQLMIDQRKPADD